MKGRSIYTLLISILALMSISSFAEDNTLTDKEKSDGWKLMFNGKDFTNWKMDKWNTNCFKIEDSSIKCYGKAADIFLIFCQNNASSDYIWSCKG